MAPPPGAAGSDRRNRHLRRHRHAARGSQPSNQRASVSPSPRGIRTAAPPRRRTAPGCSSLHHRRLKKLIVVGVDSIDTSEPALEVAFEFADRLGAPLRAVHAWQTWHPLGEAIIGLIDWDALETAQWMRLWMRLTSTSTPLSRRYPAVRNCQFPWISCRFLVRQDGRSGVAQSCDRGADSLLDRAFQLFVVSPRCRQTSAAARAAPISEPMPTAAVNDSKPSPEALAGSPRRRLAYWTGCQSSIRSSWAGRMMPSGGGAVVPPSVVT